MGSESFSINTSSSATNLQQISVVSIDKDESTPLENLQTEKGPGTKSTNMLNAVLSTSSDHNKRDGGHSALSKRSLEKMNDLCDEKELVGMIKHMDRDKSLFHPQSKPLDIIKKMDKLHSNLLPESYLN